MKLYYKDKICQTGVDDYYFGITRCRTSMVSYSEQTYRNVICIKKSITYFWLFTFKHDISIKYRFLYKVVSF